MVLGGTVFLGRHVAETALARGHDVTLFNRGSRPDVLPGAEHLRGDRDGGLDVLRGRRWDAVVDCSGYVPRLVGQSAALLADQVEHYTFVSSVSVYPVPQADKSEDAPKLRLEEEGSEDVGRFYGALKLLSENAAQSAMPGRVACVRPGLIVGPHDQTERFTYWVRRIARGGDVLAPGPRDREVQLIDARDLAEWILLLAERRTAGTWNATGPAGRLSMEDLLHECLRTLESDARLVWVDDEEWLLEHGAEPWMGLPLWIPASMGSLNAPIGPALAAGLQFRPLQETILDTLHWAASRAHPPQPPPAVGRLAGLPEEKEAELLAAWRAGGRG